LTLSLILTQDNPTHQLEQVVLRFLFALSLIFALASPADSLAASSEHVRDAFALAERDKWSDALAHARQASDPVLLKLITWQYLLDADSGASFDEITRFIDENPKWLEIKRLRVRAEQALRNDDVPDKEILGWFGNDSPLTGIGKIALAEALKRSNAADSKKINSLIREGWRAGDFDEPQEKRILSTYSSLLTDEDHIARIDRLLWEERIAPAKRLLKQVPNAYEKLFKARMALIENKKLANASLLLVPSSLKKDPGLIYDRMRYRARRDDENGVREMLLMAPAQPPYPEKWWKYREQAIREAIDKKEFSAAQKLLANHGQTEGASLADAMWLQGWIKCEFQDQPQHAYKDFYDLYDKVNYPVSKARAAYWAGRAAFRSGKDEDAKKWYAIAASYPTTFYGQLSWLKSKEDNVLRMPSPPAVSSEERSRFNNRELTKAIKLSIEHDVRLASRLITLAMEASDNAADRAMLAELGNESGHPALSVRAAKKALQQNVVLVSTGYPQKPAPNDISIEKALTLAITRQESEFDPYARSPSNALGMMQLLPGTAKETAKKHHIGYSKDKLYEPQYNMTLGSHYLARMINSYDGSYVLAIAAYNAGPGNVRKWMQRFGTPGNSVDNAVNWIEKIPFAETRNYVQRVLENLQVYRHLESKSEIKLALGQDLER
jgi:soluble lytic murein transglycosylase